MAGRNPASFSLAPYLSLSRTGPADWHLVFLRDADAVLPGAALISRLLAGRIFRWGFVALTLAFGIWYIAEEWSGIHSGLSRIGLPVALGALGCVLAALVCTMLVWRVLMAGLG